MMNYNEKDKLSQSLSFILERFGVEAFAIDGRVVAILSDLAPSLINDRIMFERMDRRGVLKDFAKASSASKPEKERVVAKSLSVLTQSEYIMPSIAAKYIQLLVELLDWNVPVPMVTDVTDNDHFDVKQFRKDSQDKSYVMGMEAYSNNNFAQAFRYFELAYNNGNWLAGVKLGQLYYYGEGCKQSYQRALQLFLEGHANNNPLASAWVADYYRIGRCVPKDQEKAKHIMATFQSSLLEMCGCGDPDAQYMLGYDYLYGTYDHQNVESAFSWIENAADTNHRARVKLAECYLYGYGCSVDVDKGLDILRRCSDNRLAQYKLAVVYYEGKLVPQDYGTAYKLFSLAAEADHAGAQDYLGDMFSEGKGIPKDSIKAVEWYQKSAAKGNKWACESLAYHYFNGEGVEENKRSAFEYFKKAADKGLRNAQYMLHYFYLGKIGDDQFVNYELGRQCLEMAASKDHVGAMRELALYYLFDKYGNVNDNKYCEWIIKAAEKKDSRAEWMVGNMYAEGFVLEQNDDQAKHWLGKAVIQEQIDAYVTLGELLLKTGEKYSGMSGMECLERAEDLLKNDTVNVYATRASLQHDIAELYTQYGQDDDVNQRAFELYFNAYSEGMEKALYNVCWMHYIQGYNHRTIEIDRNRLFQELLIAETNSTSSSIAYLLGKIYYNGDAPAEENEFITLDLFSKDSDKREAERWWKIAIEKGSLSAYCRLAEYYVNDRKEPEAGFEILEEGHVNGSAEATYLLGMCYAKGIGVKKSRRLAKMYYREAADAGNDDAKNELKKFLF